jgi:urease accessory protein UreE
MNEPTDRAAAAPDSIVIAGLSMPRAADELLDLERDVVELTFQERAWPRRRVTSQGGRVLTLMLPPDEVPRPGCLLHVGPGWYIVVEAALEPVRTISPLAPREEIRVAIELGKRHSMLALDEGQLLVPDEPSMERLLWKLAVPWTRDRRRCIPISTGTPH